MLIVQIRAAANGTTEVGLGWHKKAARQVRYCESRWREKENDQTMSNNSLAYNELTINIHNLKCCICIRLQNVMSISSSASALLFFFPAASKLEPIASTRRASDSVKS
jgi:hypothetical protein